MNTDWIIYLTELRKRIFLSLFVFSVIFLISLYFSNALFDIVTRPLQQQLQQTFIATHLLTTVLTPIHLAFYAALFLSMPLLLFQGWKFISPALYAREKKLSRTLILMSIVLFYLGILFAYFVVLPLITRFLLLFLPQNLSLLPEISQYISFSQTFLLLFGFLFEIPLLMFFLVFFNIVSLEMIKNFRRYYIVLSFVIGMLLTPPDVLSQILVAIPMCLLFEAGILLTQLMRPKTHADISPSHPLPLEMHHDHNQNDAE